MHKSKSAKTILGSSLADVHFSLIQPSSFIVLPNGDWKRRRNKKNYLDLYLERKNYLDYILFGGQPRERLNNTVQMRRNINIDGVDYDSNGEISILKKNKNNQEILGRTFGDSTSKYSDKLFNDEEKRLREILQSKIMRSSTNNDANLKLHFDNLDDIEKFLSKTNKKYVLEHPLQEKPEGDIEVKKSGLKLAVAARPNHQTVISPNGMGKSSKQILGGFLDEAIIKAKNDIENSTDQNNDHLLSKVLKEIIVSAKENNITKENSEKEKPSETEKKTTQRYDNSKTSSDLPQMNEELEKSIENTKRTNEVFDSINQSENSSKRGEQENSRKISEKDGIVLECKNESSSDEEKVSQHSNNNHPLKGAKKLNLKDSSDKNLKNISSKKDPHSLVKDIIKSSKGNSTKSVKKVSSKGVRKLSKPSPSSSNRFLNKLKFSNKNLPVTSGSEKEKKEEKDTTKSENGKCQNEKVKTLRNSIGKTNDLKIKKGFVANLNKAQSGKNLVVLKKSGSTKSVNEIERKPSTEDTRRSIRRQTSKEYSIELKRRLSANLNIIEPKKKRNSIREDDSFKSGSKLTFSKQLKENSQNIKTGVLNPHKDTERKTTESETSRPIFRKSTTNLDSYRKGAEIMVERLKNRGLPDDENFNYNEYELKIRRKLTMKDFSQMKEEIYNRLLNRQEKEESIIDSTHPKNFVTESNKPEKEEEKKEEEEKEKEKKKEENDYKRECQNDEELKKISPILSPVRKENVAKSQDELDDTLKALKNKLDKEKSLVKEKNKLRSNKGPFCEANNDFCKLANLIKEKNAQNRAINIKTVRKMCKSHSEPIFKGIKQFQRVDVSNLNKSMRRGKTMRTFLKSSNDDFINKVRDSINQIDKDQFDKLASNNNTYRKFYDTNYKSINKLPQDYLKVNKSFKNSSFAELKQILNETSLVGQHKNQKSLKARMMQKSKSELDIGIDDYNSKYNSEEFSIKLDRTTKSIFEEKHNYQYIGKYIPYNLKNLDFEKFQQSAFIDKNHYKNREVIQKENEANSGYCIEMLKKSMIKYEEEKFRTKKKSQNLSYMKLPKRNNIYPPNAMDKQRFNFFK